MANQHPAFRATADWLRSWCHLVYLGEIVAPPSVLWRRPDLKRGMEIRWQGLLGIKPQIPCKISNHDNTDTSDSISRGKSLSHGYLKRETIM